MNLKLFPALILLLLVSLLLNVFFVIHEVRPQGASQTVIEVIDGDTIVLSNNEHIRLLGVDAPEIGRCYAKEAKEYVEHLILQKAVTIKEDKKDNFCRRMALVYIGSTLINTEVIHEGYARPDYTKNSQRSQFIEAYDYAKKNRLGISGDVCIDKRNFTEADSSCTIKGNVDKASGKKFYHFPSCSHYKQIVLDLSTAEQFFCTEKEAIEAGFVKADGCGK